MSKANGGAFTGHGSGQRHPQPQQKKTVYEGAQDSTSGARVLDLHAGAEYIGVSYWTLRDLVLAGIIPTVKIPSTRVRDGRSIRRTLVDRRDLDAFIDSNKERHE
jgi:hypothetical protein